MYSCWCVVLHTSHICKLLHLFHRLQKYLLKCLFFKLAKLHPRNLHISFPLWHHLPVINELTWESSMYLCRSRPPVTIRNTIPTYKLLCQTCCSITSKTRQWWCIVHMYGSMQLYSASQKKRNREVSMFYHNLITTIINEWYIFGKLRVSSFMWCYSDNAYFTHEWLKAIWRKETKKTFGGRYLAPSEIEFVCFNYENVRATFNKQNFVIPGSFFLIEVSYERAENELSRNMNFSWNSDTARQITFWFPSFKLLLITHAWNMHHVSSINWKRRL